MSSLTWRDMFGFDYGPGMPQPVDLGRKRTAPQTQRVKEMLALLGTAAGLGAPAPTGPAEGFGRGAVTPHNVGAAIDIRYHTETSNSTRAFGNALVELFIRQRKDLGWSYMAYNHMHFTPTRVEDAPEDGEHIDHIHIEWIDNSFTKHSKALSSFTYFEKGITQTKKVEGRGQTIALTSNKAADASLPSSFVSEFNAVCSSASAKATRYAAFTASDFAAAFHGAANDI